MNKTLDTITSYFKYVMCVFAFLSILGVLIPTKVLGISVGNYFGLASSGYGAGAVRAVIVIICCVAFIICAIKFDNELSAICIALAVIVMIAAGVKGMGAAAAFIKGGMKIIRFARVFMIITAVINTVLLLLKKNNVSKQEM